jgi:coenzyme F420-reducing hydrogenase gamma subunit
MTDKELEQQYIKNRQILKSVRESVEQSRKYEGYFPKEELDNIINKLELCLGPCTCEVKLPCNFCTTYFTVCFNNKGKVYSAKELMARTQDLS